MKGLPCRPGAEGEGRGERTDWTVRIEPKARPMRSILAFYEIDREYGGPEEGGWCAPLRREKGVRLMT